ncbi:uncharacterized protein LOC116350692 [Contarinia nasturtii]|uniref:uncharacterized protein LOC116350692 n=1 Tax=Contarinia nasturtii TaxID=265458 RepID=UPI0012D4002F|nr:uncharacterized protein LOC116350692 [Contarinia nasturtii]
MFSFCNYRIVFSFVLISVSCCAELKEPNKAEKPSIDYLTLDYLSVEQSLWSRLSHAGDKNDHYSLLQSEHLPFFANDFGVSQNTQQFVPSGYLANNLSLVNGLFYNMSVILKSNSTDAINIYHVHEILDHSIEYGKNVFQEAIRAEFWNKGKDYVQHCRETESKAIIVESEFQLIYNYYKDVRAALLKTYMLTQLSHMLININNKGSNVVSSQRPYYVKDELDLRVDLIRRNVKNLLKIAKRDSWVCDRFPYVHVDEYIQVTKFLQGYVDNELNFNQEDTCKNTCEDFTNTNHVRCADKTLCAQNRNTDLVVCNGQIRDCQEIPSEDVEVCYGNDTFQRYHYLKYSDGKMHGSKPRTGCSQINHANSWRRWFVKCSSCYCLCDDPNNSERHFSLHPVVSDVENNKVITGVRLIKKNGVIQFSISERTLRAFGQTDESDNTWKEAEYQFATSDPDALDGVDYFTLTYENRSINLDDLVLPQGRVVTGVRFFNLNGHLILQIRSTSFDYFTGRLLNVSHNPWVMNENGGQTEIEIVTKENPLANIVASLYIPDTTPNAFVQFGPSDIRSDVGQSTLPLIDTSKLESRNPVVLSGIGLIYKRNDDSGGFIGVKTITYDFAIADITIDEEYDYID